MRRLICTLLLTLGAAQSAQAQASGPVLTLDEAIRLALRNNPLYLQSTTSQQRAGAALRASRGQLLPQLSTSFGSSYREGRPQ
ncbi:MAG: TolC family protein, partial [Gemmatimonadaceae bacterium]